MSTVSIITRTKNRPLLLDRAIKSVLNQTHQDWQMIIVNDGGDPAPVDQMVQAHADLALDRINVLHNQSSLGMEAASNAGLAIATGKYVVIHDDDDSWAPEFLATCTHELAQQQTKLASIRGIACRAIRVLEEIRGTDVITRKVEKFMPDVQPGLLPLNAMLRDNMFAPIQFMYERSTLDEIGGYREDLPVLGDWEFNTRFMRNFDIYYTSRELAFYHHRITDKSSAYGNSVIAGNDKHVFYRQALRNEWLRDDIKNNRAGVTAHANTTISGAVADTESLQKNIELLTRYNILLSIRGLEKRIRHALKKA